MPEITFDSDTSLEPERRVAKVGASFSLIPLVLRTGIVSTEQNAKRLLLAVALIGFFIAFMVPHFFSGTSQPVLTPLDKVHADAVMNGAMHPQPLQ